MVVIQDSGVNWVHQDPVTKSQRITNSSGSVTSTIDLDPWGAETARSSNQAFQPHRFTSYERDADGGDDAMHRRYGNYWARFSQPDPYDGSYNLTDPQSFNRFAYVQNDPVNFVDPSGLNAISPGTTFGGGILWTVWYGNNTDGWRVWNQWFEPYGPSSQQIEDMRERIEKMVSNETCSRFISNLINGTATKNNPAEFTNALTGFNQITGAGQGGIVYGDTVRRAHGFDGATVHGSISQHSAQIELPTPAPFPRGLSRDGARQYREDHGRLAAQSALHETIHLAGRYGFTDYALAMTVARMLGETPTFKNTREESDYWNRALQSACFS